MKCAICGIRKPRRYCPGVRGDICTICCATEREQTVDCLLDCVYLADAHDHEKLPEADAIPNIDIEVSESFLRRNEPLFVVIGAAIARAASTNAMITDYDAREALAALVQRWRTLESGLYYDARPTNPYAAAICEAVTQSIEELREYLKRETGMAAIRDADILGVLAFMQRLEYRRNNGRKKSKAFLEFIHRSFPPGSQEEPQRIQTEEPRIII